MRISGLSMIGVIKAFHGYCVSRGTDLIHHTDEQGHASFDVCAVGELTKSIKTPLSADKVWHNYIAPALKHYQPKVDQHQTITYLLPRSTEAKEHYPTYDKLADALAKCIK